MTLILNEAIYKSLKMCFVLSYIWRQLILRITFILFTKHLQIVIRWQPYFFLLNCLLFWGVKRPLWFTIVFAMQCIKIISMLRLRKCGHYTRTTVVEQNCVKGIALNKTKIRSVLQSWNGLLCMYTDMCIYIFAIAFSEEKIDECFSW